MTKRLQSKHRISRRFGEDIWGRAKNSVSKRKNKPGVLPKMPSRPTDYGVQLAHKQKLKFFYGNITEKQFKNYYLKAANQKGNSEENMVALLERRIDIVLFRTKMAKTVFAARQMVNHKHVLVNGKAVNIPSYLLSPSDVIQVRESAHHLAKDAIATEQRDMPVYVEADHEALQVKFLAIPSITEVHYPVIMNHKAVIEFYSR